MEFTQVLSATEFKQAEPTSTSKKSLGKEQIPVMMANALKLIAHSEFRLAISLLRQILNLDPFNKVAMREISFCLIKIRKFEEATKILLALTEFEPSFQNFKILASVAYESEQLELAKDNYMMALRCLQYEPAELFEIYKNLGNIFLKQNDPDAAEDFYHKAFTIKSEDESLLINLASLEMYKKQIDEAQIRFQQVLFKNPRSEKAWVGLALVHLQKNDLELALANLKTALEIDPLNRTALQIFCKTAIQERNYIEASEYLQDYLSAIESDEEMSLVLIHLFCLMGHSAYARIELERALLWNPKSESLLKIEAELNGKTIPY